MERFNHRRRYGPVIISAVMLFLVSLVSTAAPAQSKAAAAKNLAPGSFALSVVNQRVSLEANDASVAKIFRELGHKAGIAVDLQSGSDETVSIKLDQVSLEEAIKRLSDNVALFYGKDPKEQSYRIERIAVVVLKGGEASGGLQGVPLPSPSTTTAMAKAAPPAPAANPEPFKFTFKP